MNYGALGEIRLFAGTRIPDQWQACNGQTLNVAEYSELYLVIGNAFGGTANTTFALPSLKPLQTVTFSFPGVQYMICTLGAYPSGGGLEGMIGEIRLFAGSTAPLNWAFCDGSLMNIGQNDLLYSVVGANYGGDGTQTFALPLLPELNGARYIICTEGAYPAYADDSLFAPVETMLGEIRLWAGVFGGGPAGFSLLTNPTLLNVNDNFALYTIVGNEYGGNFTTTFQLPQLTPLTAQAGSPGTSYVCALYGLYPSFN
ncbi:tail fiber protein [bacterium]|nr:tail fiber protein [bacterium]